MSTIVYFLDWFQKTTCWWSHHFPIRFYSNFHITPCQEEKKTVRLFVIQSIFEFLRLYVDVPLNFFLWLSTQKMFLFLLPLLSFGITSETSSPLNAHSGQMANTGHFLVPLYSLLNSFFPSSVGSIILAMICPWWQAQRIRVIQECKDLINKLVEACKCKVSELKMKTGTNMLVS